MNVGFGLGHVNSTKLGNSIGIIGKSMSATCDRGKG